MLKIASKFAMDIFPSVIATIIGAYIVNHYIVSKPADAPTTAAISSIKPKKADLKTEAKPAERSADLGSTPEPGVRAKGISEKAVSDRAATDRVTFEKPVIEKPVVEKPADKADKPAETASIPTETHRHPVNPREKAVAKAVPAVEPAIAAPALEAAITPDRDANDLARAAIERLRGTPEASSHAPETARLPDSPRVVTAPATSLPAPSLQPLPPPILVSTPPAEAFNAAPGSAKPSHPATAQGDDPLHPTPPADIPDPAPLDLRADAVDPQPQPRQHTNVAEDVLSAAKSMFHAVLPNNSANSAK